jgi:hypothetical protein
MITLYRAMIVMIGILQIILPLGLIAAYKKDTNKMHLRSCLMMAEQPAATTKEKADYAFQKL